MRSSASPPPPSVERSHPARRVRALLKRANAATMPATISAVFASGVANTALPPLAVDWNAPHHADGRRPGPRPPSEN